MSKVEEVCANNPTRYRPGSLWSPKTQEPMTSLLFPTRENLMDAVSIYSIHRNRVLRVTKSNAESWVAICKVANEKGCKWYLRAKLKANLGLWMITRYTGPHTCLYASISSDNPHLTSTLATKVLMGHIKNNPDYKVTDIIETIKDRFEMTISYRKACIAKNKAIQMAFGDWDDSYKHLSKFLTAMQHYNPGTVVKYVTSSTNLVGTHVLESVFWAMGGCIEGFKYCRPLITIDATFLKGKYKGVIMVANGVDANGQIFPLAFAIADGECKENWGFFLHNLRKHVVKDRADICLILDRGGGIIAAVNNHRNGWTKEEYGVHHVFCIRHIQGNLMNVCSDHKAAIGELMMKAATEHQVRKFEEAMSLIKAINENAEKWLRKIPLEKWTLSHDGGRRYGILTSNLAKSFNNALLGARALPITALVESIYFRINKYFSDRYLAAKRLCESRSGVTPQVHERINKCKKKSSSHEVRGHNYERGIFTVHSKYQGKSGDNVQTVRLEDRYCSCGKWSIYGHPCSHVIAACQSRAKDWMEYVPHWFHVTTWAQIYEHTIMPIENRAYWPHPTHETTFIPNSTLLRSRGKAKNKRIHSDMDFKKKWAAKCTLCNIESHDRRTCPSGRKSRRRAPIL